MPTALTPPDLNQPDVDDHGGGRRPPQPPAPKRTGGNGDSDGDNDNWDSRPHGHRGPQERLRSARIGLFLATAAIYMFFIAIASAFFVSKVSGHFDAYNHYVNQWLPVTLPSILWLNTAILLLSTCTAEFARRSMFHEHEAMEEWIGLGRPLSRRAAGWLIATLILGGLFVYGQVVAWQQLASTHLYLGDSPSSHYFYLLTILHAGHLLIGIGALFTALIILLRSRSLQTRQVWTDCTVWYWHAMGLLWILLFCLLEFCQ